VTTIFGEVAALYDRARPAYPPRLADVTLAYAGRPPRHAAEIGAGTGKGTILFAGRGFPITCLEPDPRMSSLIDLPSVSVVTSTFEDWSPPAGGVDLLFAVTAWHWVDPARRVPLAARALAPGGTLALVHRRSTHQDAALAAEITEAFRRFPPATEMRPPLPSWALPELRSSPEMADCALWEEEEDVTVTADDYLDSMQTMSPFRRRPPEDQRGLLRDLRQVIDERIAFRTTTSLVLARRS
jgi:trans-aconitate methyltransferase